MYFKSYDFLFFFITLVSVIKLLNYKIQITLNSQWGFQILEHVNQFISEPISLNFNNHNFN